MVEVARTTLLETFVWALKKDPYNERQKRTTTEQKIPGLKEVERPDKTILDCAGSQRLGDEQTFHRWKREFGLAGLYGPRLSCKA